MSAFKRPPTNPKLLNACRKAVHKATMARLRQEPLQRPQGIVVEGADIEHLLAIHIASAGHQCLDALAIGGLGVDEGQVPFCELRVEQCAHFAFQVLHRPGAQWRMRGAKRNHGKQCPQTDIDASVLSRCGCSHELCCQTLISQQKTFQIRSYHEPRMNR